MKRNDQYTTAYLTERLKAFEPNMAAKIIFYSAAETALNGACLYFYDADFAA